jgi:hypothetical protein
MPRRKHLLRIALNDGSPLRKHLKGGMAAFAPAHHRLVADGERSRVGDSLDLDAATRDEFPEAHRWDYILSVPDLSEIIGIEPHVAKDSEVSVVIAKKRHAAECLRNHLRGGYRVTRWFWVSPSTVGFSRMDRARRRLDQEGIAFAGRILQTFDVGRGRHR